MPSSPPEFKLLAWLDSLRADLICGWRQLAKRPAVTAAAVVSLGIAIGSCTAAFRLADALLLRPLPVANAGSLYSVVLRGTGPDGAERDSDSNEYPQFVQMRSAVKNDADLIAVSWAELADLTYGSDAEMEKAHRQYVSGSLFWNFGLQPALGRLLTDNDDLKPMAKPYAVLSYEYWTRRFGRDPNVVGRRFIMGKSSFEIVGVARAGFTGTEPGTFTDIFLPTMMHQGVTHDDWSWFRTFLQMKPGGSRERVRDQLQTIWSAIQGQRAKAFTNWPPGRVQKYLAQQLILEPAASGQSYMRKSYRVAIAALAVIVALVLFIACANVANLLTAQAAAWGREMALRVSIGAGRWRLIQLVLVESMLLSGMATVAGALFAWWSAPMLVARINPPEDPARLDLPADWRILAFTVLLAIGATLLFGLLPALRASGVRPALALRGGDDPRSRQRLMYTIIALQVAFCVAVHLGAGVFAATVRHLTTQPLGFSADRLLTVNTVSGKPVKTEFWYQAADRLRQLPGVEGVALAAWPLLSGVGANGFVSVNGAPPGPVLGYFLNVSPGWLDVMKIPLLDGRDFTRDDQTPGVAIVNQAFVREYFGGQNPLGRTFDRGKTRFRVVGIAADARYRNLRERITPTAYTPMRYPEPEGLTSATFLVRTRETYPLAMAPLIQQEIPRIRSEFRVSALRTQAAINDAQTVRERLLASLAMFFAAVAALLAGVGLYGVLDYSILQRRRELGIRIALGAPASEIARRIAYGVTATVLVGAVSGSAVGILLAPRIEALLYQVKAYDAGVLLVPCAAVLIVTILAICPAVIRGMRIDPVTMLRQD